MKKRTPFQLKEKSLSETSFVRLFASSGSTALPSSQLHSSIMALATRAVAAAN